MGLLFDTEKTGRQAISTPTRTANDTIEQPPSQPPPSMQISEKLAKKSDLEKKFNVYFGRMVKEWNPCYADGGEWRYKRDEEIGAYDVDVVVGEELGATGGAETAEGKALAMREVTAA